MDEGYDCWFFCFGWVDEVDELIGGDGEGDVFEGLVVWVGGVGEGDVGEGDFYVWFIISSGFGCWGEGRFWVGRGVGFVVWVMFGVDFVVCF